MLATITPTVIAISHTMVCGTSACSPRSARGSIPASDISIFRDVFCPDGANPIGAVGFSPFQPWSLYTICRREAVASSTPPSASIDITLQTRLLASTPHRDDLKQHRLPACIERRQRLFAFWFREKASGSPGHKKAKLVGGSIQAGSLCYFALRTGTRGIEIFLETPPGTHVEPRRIKSDQIHCGDGWGVGWALDKSLLASKRPISTVDLL